jgi:localization factor PodJL
MSRSEGHGRGGEPTANVGQGGERGVGASLSINEILEAVVERLAASERRQADALEAMQTRISELSEGAGAQGGPIPQRLRSEFDRLQQAVTRLLSTATGESSPTASPDAAAPNVAAPGPQTAAGRSGSVDPFEFADNQTAGNPDQPWDQDTAEELTRLYEAGVAGLPCAVPASEAVSTEPVHASIETRPLGEHADLAVAPAPAPQQQTAPPKIEKEWLEDRFAEVAVRIEQILAADRRHAPLQDINERFSSLEDRLSAAVRDLAKRSDVAGLGEVEACISEMAHQLENTHLELARVTELEQQVRELAERVSEERLAALAVAPSEFAIDPDEIADVVSARLSALGFGEPPPAPRVDAHEIATIVAERLAEERPHADAADRKALDAGQVDELKSMINDLVEKRHDEGEHTSNILEAVQQAMIRLLDRMDALEANAQAPGHGARPAPPRRDPAQPAPAPQTQASEPAPPAQPPQSSAGEDIVPPLRAHVPEPEEPRKLPALDGPASPASGNAPAESEARPSGLSLDDYHPRRQDAEGYDDAHDSDSDAADTDETPHRDRRHFMEAARRAAQQANERARVAAEQPAKPSRKLSIPFFDSAGSGDAKSSESNKSASATGKRRIVVTAIAVLLIGMGATALMMKSSSLFKRHLMGPQTQTQDMLGQNRSGQPAPAKVPAAIAPTKDGNANAGTLNGGEINPAGVLITPTGAPISADELARRERHRQSAIWSSAVGSKLQPTDRVPASLVPSEGTPQTTASVTGGAPGQRVTSLPSALIGPLSLRIAAANGDPSAEFEVGARYAEGKGPEQDFKQAITWYRRAATRGFALAQYRLATLYERGLGVAADPARAKIWYQRAADQGNVKAMHNLAVLAAGTVSGQPDYGTAARWFEQAAERGLGDSQFNLAILYQSGLGVKRDLTKSYTWFGIAARHGDKAAQQRQTDIARQLSAVEVANADRLIATWRMKSTSRLANNPHYAGEQWKQRAKTNN